MATVSARALQVSQTIEASAEKLFRAWTDPEELKHWWRMEEAGWSFADASIDLRVGGSYRLGMKSPAGQTHVAIGVYREIDPPRRLVFTWEWEDPASSVGETLVTVEFEELGGNTTRVTLTHERFPDSTRVANHERGWTQLLRLLDSAMHRQ